MSDWHGRETLDLGTELMDRQLVDPHGVSVGMVDDVELRLRDDGRLEVVALLTGIATLQRRLPRWIARPLAASAALVGGADPERRVPVDTVAGVESEIRLTTAGAEATANPAADRARRTVARIPGAGHASG